MSLILEEVLKDIVELVKLGFFEVVVIFLLFNMIGYCEKLVLEKEVVEC